MGSNAPKSTRGTASRTFQFAVLAIAAVAVTLGGAAIGRALPFGPATEENGAVLRDGVPPDPIPDPIPPPRTAEPDVGADATPESSQEPTHALDCARLGVYQDSSPASDLETLQHFGAHPAVANTFYQPDQRIDVQAETERIRRGTSPNITVTTSETQRIEALASGDGHPQYDAAYSWLLTYVDDLAAIASVDPSVPVYATIEHEFRAKVRTGMVTGASADTANYGQVLDLFYKLAEAAHPNIRTTYWIVGYDREFEGAVAEHFTNLPDAILFDPYASEPGETIVTITDDDLAWIRSQAWYVGQEIGLGEFGMRVEQGDAELARFFTDVSTALASRGIAWGVFFNRERDFDTRIVDRSDGKIFRKAVAAFRDSLAAAC